MKFLEIQSFQHINSLLSCHFGELEIDGRLEAYSCKRAGSDKKLYNDLECHYSMLAKSPDAFSEMSTSPFGPLSERTSRNTLIYLIATLNASFPDYDFRDVKSWEFRKEINLNLVANAIDNIFVRVFSNYSSDMKPKLWTTLDSEIQLSECSIYSYVPDAESDSPFSEDGSVWSFNYFFYNRKLKRVVYFTCRAFNRQARESSMPGMELDLVDGSTEHYLRRGDNDDYFMF